MPDDEVRGPASCFPSIVETYGRPIDHWMNVLTQAGPRRHRELVTLLKTDHGLGHGHGHGHGHANALVAAFLAKRA